MKKLLLVTDAWHPQVNGVVTTFANLIPRLEAYDVSVSIIHPGMFFSLPVPGYSEIRLSLFSRKTIRRTIEEVQPDFVHIATEGPLGWTARSLCTKQGLAFSTAYATRFDLYAEYRFGGLRSLTRYFLKRFHQKSARVLVATNALKEYITSAGITRGVVSPLGVDTDVFTRKEVIQDARISSPVFAYFGRVATEKGVEEFLQCTLPGTKIVIGDGPERKTLEKKYPTTLFVGVQKGAELVDWLSRVDVCVFPSRTDTFGLTIIEALSCGIPVAAHSCLGPRDILTDGVDGVLEEDLSLAAVRCLTLDRSQCRKKAECYSWDSATTAFIQNLVPVRDSA
jgi:glycosyltransferase involved in cell wall biosynthesis